MALKVCIIGLLVILGMYGCTIKATIDTTTDGTTEFVSSTSGKTWWTEEGLVKQGEHVGAFVSVNYDNLLQDIAKGEGEYLLAFETILNVPSRQQQTFAFQLQRNYRMLSNIPIRSSNLHVDTFINQVELLTGYPS
jgi:hypothetical protein